MNRNRKSKILTFGVIVALTVAVWTALANGQSAPDLATAPTHVYDITQFGQTLGQTSMTILRSPEGTTARSTVTITGLLQAENVLVTRPDGSAVSYQLNGVAQGAAFQLDALFSEGVAEITFTQGGASQAATLGSGEPYYVFDNNFLEGFQVAADQVMAAGHGRVFHALVPQTLAEATLTFSDPQGSQVELDGQTVDVTVISVQFDVAGQQLIMALMLDEAGDLLVLEQQPGMVRFVRRAADDEGAQEDGANSSDAAAPAPPLTAERSLQANAHCVAEREVTIQSTGETLYGRLTLPVSATTGGAPAPVLLILPGSGAVDVDGNAPPFIVNQGYRQLAFELACHGYGALRVAKLGIAPSTGDANAVTLQTYAQNTADWLAFLTEQPEVNASRIGILGHSEGGLIALYAAANDYVRPAVIVLAASPGRPLDVLLREQLIASFVRGGATGEDLDAWIKVTDEALEAVRASEGPTLEMVGELRINPIAASFAHAAGLLRSEFEQDPAELATHVSAPVLVVQGLKDIQVLQVDGRNLAAALPNGTLLEFADLSHNMVHVPGDALSGMVPAPDAVLSETLKQAVVTWLNGHLRAAR